MKEQKGLLEAHYEEVHRKFPAALERLAAEVFAGPTLEEVILYGCAALDNRFFLLCATKGGGRVQINGRVEEGFLFGASNTRFERGSLRMVRSSDGRSQYGDEEIVIDDEVKPVRVMQYMQMVDGWSVVCPGFVSLATGALSFAAYPELYPDCTNPEEAAKKIAADFTSRAEAGIVAMVENTFGKIPS